MNKAQNSQIRWVKEQLREYGRVSRNEALARHLTRLWAIIHTIRKSPEWEIKGRWTEGQKDYVYEVVKKPYIPKLVWSEEKQAMVYQEKICTQEHLY